VITANYPDTCREVVTIMKTVVVCPISDDDFSPGDEFSAYATAKSPSDDNSTRSSSDSDSGSADADADADAELTPAG
jgi:hypothetical protein